MNEPNVQKVRVVGGKIDVVNDLKVKVTSGMVGWGLPWFGGFLFTLGYLGEEILGALTGETFLTIVGFLAVFFWTWPAFLGIELSGWAVELGVVLK